MDTYNHARMLIERDQLEAQLAALAAERDGLRALVERLENSVDTLLAFVNGKITRQELEERIR